MNVRDTQKKVFSFAEEHRMLQDGDAVVAGVSGGADSVCLLFLLCQFRKQLQLKMQVVHVDHGIRDTAERDSQFVRHLCEKWDVPFSCIREDVPALARAGKVSEEEAGRMVRYRAFEKAAEAMAAEYADLPRFPRIAIAHTENDNAETLLFRLIRGSGLRGLAGIPPVRDNIIRPLLCLRREEVEECLKDARIPWMLDETNLNDTYVRNRIRHTLLPAAEEIVPNVVERMNDAAFRLRSAEDYLRIETEKAIFDLTGQKQAVQDETAENTKVSSYDIGVNKLNSYHIAIRERVILELLEQLTPHHKDIGSTQVEQVLELASREGNRGISLPMGIEVQRSYDRLILRMREELSGEPPLGKLNVSELPGSPGLYEELLPFFAQNQYTKYMDCDKIKQSFELRTRREGDFIRISDGRGGLVRQSLKNWFINQKIPAKIRDMVPLVAAGSEICWIVGYRTSDGVKVRPDSKRIIRVDYTKE